MKKIILIGIVMAVSNLTFAQVPNPGFELLNPDNTLQHWQNMTAYAIGLNDSILTDNFTTYVSTQANSGQYALELRNSYNVTQGVNYPGTIDCVIPDSTIYQQFNTKFPITIHPYQLDFYYKFSQNPYQDSTMAEVRVFNSDLFEIGLGHTLFWTVNSSYQPIAVPIQYVTSIPAGQGDSIPAFASIWFKNVINVNQPPHVGQRVLIDQLGFNATPTGLNEWNTITTVAVYPNPVQSTLNFASIKEVSHYKLYNMLGDKVDEGQTKGALDVSHLSPGIYHGVLNTLPLPTTFRFQKQ